MVQAYSSLRLAGAALAVMLLLAGCPAPAPRPSPRAPLPPASATPRPPAAGTPSPAGKEPAAAVATPAPRAAAPLRENHLSPATQALVGQARASMAHGDLDGASATLDRALRIEPGNPLLWIERGRLRLAEGDAHQAEGCARKALALASGDRSAQRQAGRVLADSLRAEQRNPEAREVESQSYMQ